MLIEKKTDVDIFSVNMLSKGMMWINMMVKPMSPKLSNFHFLGEQSFQQFMKGTSESQCSGFQWGTDLASSPYTFIVIIHVYIFTHG